MSMQTLVVRPLELRALGERHDSTQDVVEVVRDATRQRAQRFQSLRLTLLLRERTHLLFDTLALGDQLREHDQPADLSTRLAPRTQLPLQPLLAAIGALEQ